MAAREAARRQRVSKLLRRSLSKNCELPRVVLDDQLLLDGQRDCLAHRSAPNLAGKRGLIELEPLRHPAAIDALECGHDAPLRSALLADRNRVPRLDQI